MSVEKAQDYLEAYEENEEEGKEKAKAYLKRLSNDSLIKTVTDYKPGNEDTLPFIGNTWSNGEPSEQTWKKLMNEETKRRGLTTSGIIAKTFCLSKVECGEVFYATFGNFKCDLEKGHNSLHIHTGITSSMEIPSKEFTITWK
jgi:hypothetical protein